MHAIENVLNITMNELKQMVDVDTVVGKPILTPNGQTIIPVSKVSFGFISGGGEYGAAKSNKEGADHSLPFAAGSGAGITVTPVAFVVSGKDSLRLLTVENRNLADKALEQAPELIATIINLFKNRGENNDNEEMLE